MNKSSGVGRMVKVENSILLKKVLSTMVTISGRKTTEGYAITVMESLLKNLENQYDFLKHIKIKDTRYLEEDESVMVMDDIDTIAPSHVGKAIHDLILTMNRSLGKNAGYFFFKELSRNIGDEYNTTMKEIGVDLSLMQLEHEVDELEKRILHTE
jgi:hypothetical protein